MEVPASSRHGLSARALLALLLFTPATSSPFSDLLRRALPAAPSGYTPARVACPNPAPTIRKPTSLGPDESAWLRKRRAKTVPALRDFLGRAGIDGFDAGAYVDAHANDVDKLPNVGIAISGGGYRAMLNGGGAMAAFDSRTDGSTQKGHLGGLLQSATYVSALSGGGWLVGSMWVNNFSSVQTLLEERAGSRLWDFERSIAHGSNKRGVAAAAKSLEYWNDMRKRVDRKSKAGFDTSFTDYWGLGLSQQLINAPDGGPDYTFSSIARQPGFPDGDQPMPVIVATFRAPGQIIVPRNTTVIEYTPFETGSHDPTLFGMVGTQHLGSAFEGGQVRGDQCVEGLDNAGFIMGTSSSLWNDVVLGILSTDLPGVMSVLNGALHFVADKIYKDEVDIALWNPNPFYRWNGDGRSGSSARTLTLADGGEDSQNVPLHPLVQPVRALDVIFAVDTSANTMYSWPNGSAIIATASRQSNAALANGTVFPAVPTDPRTFLNRGFSSKPVFFGCEPPGGGAPGNPAPPLIVYLANAPYTFMSNLSTLTTSVDRHTRDEMVRNGYAVATQGNGTLAPEWPACVACAMLARSFKRTGTDQPQRCKQCFSDYCWDGKEDLSDKGEYLPLMKAAAGAKNETRKKKSGAARLEAGTGARTVLGIAAAAVGAFVFL